MTVTGKWALLVALAVAFVFAIAANVCAIAMRMAVSTRVPEMTTWTEWLRISEEHRRLFPGSRLRKWRSIFLLGALVSFVSLVFILMYEGAAPLADQLVKRSTSEGERDETVVRGQTGIAAGPSGVARPVSSI
jgi:hypothetical protein